MSTENNNRIPRLRFPGFSGEWEVRTLGSIASKINRRNSRLEVTRVLTNSANSGIVDQSKYFDRDIAVKDNTANYHIVELEDFVYNPRISTAAPVGPISINKIGRGIMSPLYTVFKIHTGCIAFFEHYFQTNIWHPYLKSIANYGARFDRMNISTDGFFNMPILIPSLAEQKKIAKCLTGIDNLIAAQSDNVDALKEKKKGLMQQLFPQDGETTPRLRFPGFEGEWEEKKLGDVGSFIRGLSYNNSEVTQDSSSTLVIRSNNIIPDSIVDYKNGLVFVTKAPSEEQVLRKGDVVICLANGSSNLVGKSSSFNGDYSGIITVGAFCGIYRSELPICRYLIQTTTYKEKINIIKQGGDGSLANLYGKDILELAFYFPSQEEQNKIVECLSALDDQIAAETEKLEALKKHKRGLMQQLFPQPDNK